MRCSSKSLFFRRGGDGLGLSRLVPSKDAGEAVPLIALVCSGTLLFVVVRVLAVSLSLCLFFFFFDVMNAFFDTTSEEKSAFSPSALERWRGEGGVGLFREREMRLSVSLSLSVFPFLRCLSRRSRTKIKIRSSVGFNQESSLGRPLCRGKSFIRLDFTPRERKGNAASTSQSKRSE